MHILLVKTSSLGDVIHNLPVVSDIRQHLPSATIDWCVEEGFADIPKLHPGVGQIIPVAFRRWRKNLLSQRTWREIGNFREQLKAHQYDWVIDTQGLVKSALITWMAKGKRAGYSADAAREPMAARAYDAQFFVPKTLHAIERNRRLVAATLGYSITPELNYGITAANFSADWLPVGQPYAVLLTATSRDDKLWPEDHWIRLGQQLQQAGLLAILPGGSDRELTRAQRVAKAIPNAIAAPRLTIAELAGLLAGAQAVVGVDTGLSHLAAALGKTTIALYTATDPGLTGVLGGVGNGRFRNLGGKDNVPTVDDVIQTGQALGAW
jgi:heptosyltransferase-1